MLKQDRFQTETPNVIDPGECPPSRPGRESKVEAIESNTPALSRYDSGIKHSLYTRNGNKGALSKGIPIRFVLDLDEEDDEDDDYNSDHTFYDDEDDIIFEKSRETVDMASQNKNNKKAIRKKNKPKRSRFFRDEYHDEEDDEEENGIAQARLFAKAMLNESEKRHQHRDSLGMSNHRTEKGTDATTSLTLRQMMHRASSFRGNSHHKSDHRTASMAAARASSFRSISRGSSHRNMNIPIGSNSSRGSNSNSNKPIVEKQLHTKNIWLVDETPGVVSKERVNHPGWNKLIRVFAGLMVAILVVTVFAVTASKSKASKNSSNLTSKPPVTVSGKEKLRLEEILEYLGKTTLISSNKDLYDSSSPQSRAARWLAYEDSERLAVPTIASATTNVGSSPFDFVQRYVLLVLYFSLGGDTSDSSSWTNDYHFASQDRHECSWYEQVIDPSNNNEETEDALSLAMGVSCNRELRVKSIFLRELRTIDFAYFVYASSLVG